MRNRTVEAVALVAIGLFTTFTVGTYIHDLNTHQEKGLDQQISQAFHRVGQWVQQHRSPTGEKTSSGVLAAMAQQSSSDASHLQPTAAHSSTSSALKLGSVNDARLLDIVKTLFSKLTPADWTKIVNTLEKEPPAQAEQQLSTVIDSKLSASDRAWLAENFKGQQAFGKNDVALLESALADVHKMLTPAEQKLLQQQLSQLGVDLMQ